MRKQYFIILLVFIISISCLGSIVSANMAAPPNFMSVVHLEKDGMPYNGSLSYVLNCYSHTTKQMSHPIYFRNKTDDKPDPPKLVFSVSHLSDNSDHGYYWSYLSQSCMLNGSTKTEEYCDTGFFFNDSDPKLSELCQLSVSTNTEEFSVWNASDKPVVRYSKGKDMQFDYYEFFFTFPPDNQIHKKIQHVVSSDNAISPIEYIYCSLLSIFGARC